MKRVIGVLVGIGILLVSALIAGVVCTYLTEYGSRRIAAAGGIGAAGAVAAILVYLLEGRCCRRTRCSFLVLALLILLLLAPFLSMFYPGTITYSRFGLTMYGIIPVPVLDITVNQQGLLWFRDKSHFVSIEEVEPLLSPDVKVLVIGIGWDGAVRVDPAVQAIQGVEVHILRTPAAFDLFNECVSRGIKVVLIAHSTC